MKKSILFLTIIISIFLIGCTPKNTNKIEGKFKFNKLVYLSAFSSQTKDYLVSQYQDKFIEIKKDKVIDIDGKELNNVKFEIIIMSKKEREEFQSDFQIGVDLDNNNLSLHELDLSKYKTINKINIAYNNNIKTIYQVDGKIWYLHNTTIIELVKD